MTCPRLETVAAWTLDELETAQADRFEEHYFGCDICFQRAARMRRLVAQLDASLPAILTAARRRALEKTRTPLPAINVKPGGRATIRLGSAAEVGLWVMHAPLAPAMKVDLEARSRDGALLFALSDIPFDETRGEVVLACQVHYRSVPAVRELHVRLTATDADGSHALGDYILDHDFESL